MELGVLMLIYVLGLVVNLCAYLGMAVLDITARIISIYFYKESTEDIATLEECLEMFNGTTTPKWLVSVVNFLIPFYLVYCFLADLVHFIKFKGNICKILEYKIGTFSNS